MPKVRSCFVHSCFSTSRDEYLTFHKLPTDTTMKIAWLNAINRDISENYSNGNIVCSRHFELSDFLAGSGSRKILKKGAFPKLELPVHLLRKRKWKYDDETTVSTEMPGSHNRTNNEDCDEQNLERVKSERTDSLSPLPEVSNSSEGISSSSTVNFNELDIGSFLTVTLDENSGDSPKNVINRKRSSSTESGLSEKSSSTTREVKTGRFFLKTFHTYSLSCDRLEKERIELRAKAELLKNEIKKKNKQIKRLKLKVCHLKNVLRREKVS